MNHKITKQDISDYFEKARNEDLTIDELRNLLFELCGETERLYYDFKTEQNFAKHLRESLQKIKEEASHWW